MKLCSTFTSISFSLVLLFLSSCATEEPDVITFEDIEKEFSEIDLSNGTQDVSIEVGANYFWLFRVVPPKTTPTGPVPLVIALHGASGGSVEAHKNTECYVEPGFEEMNAFIISPNAGLDEWYEQSNQEKVFHLVRMAVEYWDIDIEKIAVTGYSNGGNATWFFAETQPTTFSAGIAMASSYDTETNGVGRKIDIPLYVIHSNGDELFPIEITEAWVQSSRDAGSSIEWVEVDGLSHYAPCDYVPALKEGVTWLQETVWN